MPRFRVLLELAEQAEDQARKALGLAERRRADLQAEQERLVAERLTAAALAVGPLHEQYLNYWNGVERTLHDLRQRLIEADQAIVTARGELLAAHQRTRTFGMLRDKDLAEEAAAAERRVQKRMDDLAGTAFARRTGEQGVSR